MPSSSALARDCGREANGNFSRAERVIVPAARQLKPLLQGDRDGLCGLYAIINALRLTLQPVRPLSSHQVRALFESGVRFLAAEEALITAMCTGISAKRWRRLSKHLHSEVSKCARVEIVHERPFGRAQVVTETAAVAELEQRVGMQQVVLVELGGAYDHYSVISGYSQTSVFLFDSFGYARLSRTSCAIGSAQSPLRHRLDPSKWLVPVVCL